MADRGGSLGPTGCVGPASSMCTSGICARPEASAAPGGAPTLPDSWAHVSSVFLTVQGGCGLPTSLGPCRRHSGLASADSRLSSQDREGGFVSRPMSGPEVALCICALTSSLPVGMD